MVHNQRSYILGCFALYAVSLTGCVANTLAPAQDERAQAAAAAAANATGASQFPTNPNLPPFESPALPVVANKIKKLLTTVPMNAAEYKKLDSDAQSLPELVDGWMTSASYKDTMTRFFADAFQQSQLEGGQGDALVQSMRESYARTVYELNRLGKPFTDVFTTKTYMMTTRLMHTYCHQDTGYVNDGGGGMNQWFMDDQNWHYVVQKSRGPVSLSETADPKSANYMTFYAPKLGESYYTNSYPQTDADKQVTEACKKLDPLMFYDKNIFARISQGAFNVLNLMNGGGFAYFYPEEYKPDTILCNHRSIGPSVFTDSDDSDWRMVTINPVTASDRQTNFVNLPAFRQGLASINLYTEHAGYLTTPSFMSQWSTNKSNSARSTVNQALIVGLGGGVGDDRLVNLPVRPAVDAAHSADAACFACHQDLDPLRQFYRQSYSLFNGRQTDTKVSQIPATFAYGGVVAEGKGVTDLARIISTHPLMPIAWTARVCTWASGSPCLESDPEIKRIAAAFVATNYQFNAMVRDVMLSPLVTYQARTATVAAVGQTAHLTRRNQLCGLLAHATGLGEVCGRDQVQTGSNYSVESLAQGIPSDQYGRGVNAPLYITRPDPVIRSTLENLCALVSSKLIDGKSALPIAQQEVGVAVPALVHDLMGLSAQEDAEPINILTAHWNDVLADKQTQTTAWQSTFTLACLSPFVASSGQ